MKSDTDKYSKEIMMVKTLKVFFIIVSLSCFSSALGHDSDKDVALLPLEYEVEARSTFSAGKFTPFWLNSNLQGLGSPYKNNGWVRAVLARGINPDSKLSWGATIDLAGTWNMPASFNIHQLSAEFKYRRLYIIAGAKEFWGKYNNPRLSTGDLLFSGNSMPIPQMRIGTFGFAPFWGTNGWFSVDTYLAFGKFTDSKWIKSWSDPKFMRSEGVLYHSKGLWLRGGKEERFPLLVEIGIEMGTQFGGTIYENGKTIKMPEKFIDWLKAIFPWSGGDNTPMEEQTNVQGNMVGEYNIAIQWKPKADWSIKGYFEHYFEDHSQMTFEYGWKDALWGIEASLPSNPVITNIVLEYIYMKDQTGAVNHDSTPEIPEQVSGADNYYNHYLYSAWQNWGMGIGTPLALSPLYNDPHRIYIFNTRFIAWHLGLEGNPIPSIRWRTLFTYSENWGTYRYPYPDIKYNFSGLAEVNFSPAKLKGWYLTAALAWDRGELLGRNFGGMISIGKTGLIK
ncbi:MAG: hypothetical protein J1F12_04190 [Muribaculaceae bacterium]|nr:hypothetical protein [Muribaculaceae bacterium]